MQEEIKRIHMVISRLLKMQPVGLHLVLRFAQDDLQASLLPSFRSSQLWTQHSDEKQCYALPQQVSVGGEIR